MENLTQQHKEAKQGFANEINLSGSHVNLSANECERYGMTWGCTPDCPVFERGECELQELNQQLFEHKGLV